MTLQANLFVLLFGAIQGSLLSFWFFRNSKKENANLYFAFFLALVGLQLFLKVLSKAWLTQHIFPWYVISYQLPFLVGPILFLYVKAKCGNKFNTFDLIHFVPFLLASAIDWVFLFWLRWIELHATARAIIQLIFLGGYTIMALRLKSSLRNPFIIIIAVAEGIIIVTMALMQEYYGTFPDVRWLFVVLSLLMYWISYLIINGDAMFLTPPSPTTKLQKVTKYAHSSLSDADAKRIETLLVQCMNEDKLFLESSLTIEDLAIKLNVSKHHLSQVINERIGKAFVDYLTELRVAETSNRLVDPANERLTIASIAMDSGFNSISAFNNAFKKRYQITPSAFKRRALEGLNNPTRQEGYSKN